MSTEIASEQCGDDQREVVPGSGIPAVLIPSQDQVQLTQTLIQRDRDDPGYWFGDLSARLRAAIAAPVSGAWRAVADVAHSVAGRRHGSQKAKRRICQGVDSGQGRSTQRQLSRGPGNLGDCGDDLLNGFNHTNPRLLGVLLRPFLLED